MHDRLHLAVDALFDGVQLGFRSLDPATARRALVRVRDGGSASEGSGPAIGFSAHADDTPEARLGADFLLLGPVLPTPSHPDPCGPDHRLPLGREGLVRELARCDLPIWALGGLTPATAPSVAGLGIRGLAVRGAILGCEDPDELAAATQALLEATTTLGPSS